MNWVNGLTLTGWISNNIGRPVAMIELAARFDQLIFDLATANIAHGDLQDGNLLVTDSGSLHLVDYDGMCVPGLERSPGELGHPNEQPLSRRQTNYGPSMDVPAWLIALH